MIGFVFAKIGAGRDKEFIQTILDYSEVVEAHLTTGAWDALLIVHGRDTVDINNFNVNKLRRLRDVEDSYVSLSAAAIKV